MKREIKKIKFVMLIIVLVTVLLIRSHYLGDVKTSTLFLCLTGNTISMTFLYKALKNYKKHGN